MSVKVTAVPLILVPADPFEKVIIEVDFETAKVIKALVGIVGGAGKLRTKIDELYYAMNKLHPTLEQVSGANYFKNPYYISLLP